MSKAPVVTAGEAIKKLEEKDGEANNESARTNEILAARGTDLTGDQLKAALAANDPTLSRSAYTSHKSGFNEDLLAKEAEKDAKVTTGAKSEGQTKAVNR